MPPPASYVLKLVCKWAALVLVLIDIVVTWVNVYEMYLEISGDDGDAKGQGQGQGNSDKTNNGNGNNNNGKNDDNDNNGNSGKGDFLCDNPKMFWHLVIVFEGIGTFLALGELYHIAREIKEDGRMKKETYMTVFILIMCIYMFSALPAGVVEIFYKDQCVCSGGISIKETQKRWRKDAKQLVKGLSKGAGVMLLQFLLQCSEIYAYFRNGCAMFESMCNCCHLPGDDKMSGDLNTVPASTVPAATATVSPIQVIEHNTDNDPDKPKQSTSADAGSYVDMSGKDLSGRDQSCTSIHCACMFISILMSLAYVAVFSIEIAYMFCKQK